LENHEIFSTAAPILALLKY